jgi:HK97 family phage prohead protease
VEPDTRFADAIDDAPSLRTAPFADLEVHSIKDDLIFDGYAAVFAEKADLGEHTEELRHGSFRKFLATGANIPLVHEHDRSQLLGTTKSGRVRLSEEPRGLRVQANLAKTDLSQRIKSLVEAGDVTGMSFGFVCGRGNADWEYGGLKPHRIIKGFKNVLDVCTTFDPAYAGAEAQFRSLAFAHPESAEALKQLVLGVYPAQLDEQQDEPHSAEVDGVSSGVSTPLLAARKRQLELLTITLERGEWQ